MSVDVTELRAFYSGPLGVVAARQVGRILARSWSDLRGLTVLGIGYATPYLPSSGEGCQRSIAFMPAAQGVIGAAPGEASRTALVDTLTLPLADGAVDRILIVHALELSAKPAELLYEASRILRPSGRLVLVCPNRRGLWARMDTTPFGQGQPYSRKQIRRLLKDTSLDPETWTEALYVPPISTPLTLRVAGLWERFGAGLSLPFAGLHVVEAVRKLHRPILVREGKRARPAPLLAPGPASPQPL